MSKKSNRKSIDKVLISIGLVVTLALFCMGGLAWWAFSFTSSNVHSELASQKIYFPPKDSKALNNPKIAPYLNQYAGEELLTGAQAKAFADHFIAVHLTEVADGQTYSQVSAESLAQPSNTKLKAESQTLFQGETLRGLLLGDAYVYSTVANIAKSAAYICFISGGVMIVLVLMGFWHLAKIS